MIISNNLTRPSYRRGFAAFSGIRSRLSSKHFSMSSPLLKEPRRFAPLRESTGISDHGSVKLRGVIFDVDGTLCLPQTYMFGEMRSALSIEKPTDILDHIYTLSPSDQEVAFQKIRDIESAACATQEAQPGLVPLMTYLESKALPKGICTRNFDAPVAHLLGKFLAGMVFEPIVTRDFRPPKPDPAGILHIARSWGLVNEDGSANASQLIMVGDSIDDMTAGHRAGAATVLLVNDVNAHLADHEHTDLCISKLDELIDILEGGFVGQIGRKEGSSDTKSSNEGV